eukprot:scaffold16780_cov63-Phaeocystis_antarctica.AAC.7
MYLRRSTNQHTHSTRFFGGSILDCIGSERAGGGCTGSWKKLRALVTLRMETARQAGLKLLVGCHGLSWAAGRAHTARGLSWAVASPYISRVGVDEKSLVCNRFAREVWASKDKCARRQAHLPRRRARAHADENLSAPQTDRQIDADTDSPRQPATEDHALGSRSRK